MFKSFPVRRAPLLARAHFVARWFGTALMGVASAGVMAQAPASAADEFPSVTVTATRFADLAADLPFGVSVLTAADITAAGVTTVNEAIMKLLGVPGRLDFYGGGDYGLDLRGFGSTAASNQAVIVDGVRVDEADSSGTRLAGIPIDSVERIEVLRGSAAVLYGEGASGGAIVITTKAGRGAARMNQADVYAATGSHRLRELRGTATLAAGAFSLDAAAQRRDSDNHRENFHSSTDGASVTGQWRNDWLRAGLRHATDHLDGGLPGALSSAQYEADPRQTNTPQDSASIRNRRSSFFAEAEFGRWQLGLDAGRRAKSLTSDNGGFVYAYDVDARNYALRARHRTQFGSVANSFVAGVDRDEWTRTTTFGSVSNQHSQAFYLKDEATLASGTRLSVGGRTQRIDKDNTDTAANIDRRQRAWEIGLVQPVLDGVAVFGRYGRGFRLPNVDEFGFTSPGMSLDPQTSRDAELGVRWTRVDGRVELRLYRSALTREIGYDPSAVGPFGSGANVNFDPTLRQGLEVEVAQALAAGVNLRLNGALRRARFRAGPYEGREVPLTPRHALSLRADWSPAAGHRIDGGVTRVSSQHPDFDNACTMPGHTTVDLRYAYAWRQAEVVLGVDNLANRRYYTQAFACVSGSVESIYPEAGRTLTASLRLHF